MLVKFLYIFSLFFVLVQNAYSQDFEIDSDTIAHSGTGCLPDDPSVYVMGWANSGKVTVTFLFGNMFAYADAETTYNSKGCGIVVPINILAEDKGLELKSIQYNLEGDVGDGGVVFRGTHFFAGKFGPLLEKKWGQVHRDIPLVVRHVVPDDEEYKSDCGGTEIFRVQTSVQAYSSNEAENASMLNLSGGDAEITAVFETFECW